MVIVGRDSCFGVSFIVFPFAIRLVVWPPTITLQGKSSQVDCCVVAALCAQSLSIDGDGDNDDAAD